MWTEVMKAEYLDGYRIMVSFNDGVRRIVDFTNLINRFPIFKALGDINVFKKFRVTDTLEWDNGKIDIAPEYLYENGLPA
ncbi:DUF2442 domain-containing protein [Parabacteroides pacaensis]|uniref:DUF2442 domain-containing protein n=1 Tax=Parabacteroides pacaensis TaxID=2086575 RepID=UPI000D0E7F05|nr:DUF2442 domain-containing protein [Parabacteroides pacaensis]